MMKLYIIKARMLSGANFAEDRDWGPSQPWAHPGVVSVVSSLK